MRFVPIVVNLLTASVAAVVTAAALDSAPNGAPLQDPEMNPAQQDAMQRWMATTVPGEQHEFLAQYVGEWNTVTTMQGMGAPPSSGTAKTSMVLGGRFLMTETSGTMMGMDLQTVAYLGFDRYKNKFIGITMNTMGTNMLASEGLLDMTGSVVTMFGPMDEPMTNEHDKTVKYVHRFVDENNFVLEVHDLAIIPGETKVVEVTFARKQ